MTDTVRAEDLSAGRRWTAFAFLMIAEFLYGWSWNTVDFLRPMIREDLQLTLTQAGSAYTAQSLGALVGAVILGQLADRHGRRNVLFFIIAGFGAGAAAGVLVDSYLQLLVQRFVLGMFLGGIFPVLIGTYMGLFPSDWRGKLAAGGNGVYNLSVVALGYTLATTVAQADWHVLLLFGGLPAVLIAPLVFLLVPDDRRMTAWGSTETSGQVTQKLPILELFGPDLRRTTGLLFLLVGLNFFAYQAFAGWVTTFLKDTRGFPAEVFGPVAAWQFWGAMLGGFFWGTFSDRLGRRPAAIGFFGGAAMVLVYLYAIESADHLRYAGFTWGFMIAASVAWAPWISELFPARMRSTAMSIFNWGRIISMTSPLVTGWIAEAFGLRAAMLTSAIGFAAGGIVWLLLPEPARRTKASVA